MRHTKGDAGGPDTSREVTAAEVRALLGDADLFGALPLDALDRIAAQCLTEKLARGEVLFRQGDPPTQIFVVSSGRLAIASRSLDGRESVMALMERGDVIGEMSVFDGRGRSAEARALEASTIVVVPAAALRGEYEHDATLLWSVVELLVGRLRVTDEALSDAVFLDVPGRTAKRLLEIAGDEDSFELPITQEELAGMVGASRERVNKAIASFLRLGWLDQHDKTYRILDREQLANRAH